MLAGVSPEPAPYRGAPAAREEATPMVVTLGESLAAHFPREYAKHGTTRICDDLDDEFVEQGLAAGWMIDAGTTGRLSTVVDEDELYLLPQGEYRAIVEALQDLLAHPRPGIDVVTWEGDSLRRLWRVSTHGVPCITSVAA